MDIVVQQGNIIEAAVDAVIVNLFEGVTQPGGATGAVDRQHRRAHQPAHRQRRVQRQAGRDRGHALRPREPRTAKWSSSGLGKAEEFSPERVRQVTAVAVQAAARAMWPAHRHHRPRGGHRRAGREEAAQSVAEGALLGTVPLRQVQERPGDNGGGCGKLVVFEMDPGQAGGHPERPSQRGVVLRGGDQLRPGPGEHAPPTS